jgi:hypothetical protein
MTLIYMDIEGTRRPWALDTCDDLCVGEGERGVYD